jgi:hypothetical protein
MDLHHRQPSTRATSPAQAESLRHYCVSAPARDAEQGRLFTQLDQTG